jgi:hypothetical protein
MHVRIQNSHQSLLRILLSMSNDPFAVPNSASFTGQAQDTYPDQFFQPISRIDWGRAFKSPFQSANCLVNLLWMCVGGLLTSVIIGGPLMYGYMAEVAEQRMGGRDRNWPDFEPNRFGDYLVRGLWPYLWGIIWTLPLILIMAIPIGITVATCIQLSEINLSLPAVLMGIVGGVASALTAVLCIMMMSISMAHSAIRNDFLKGVDFAWTLLFIRKMFWTMLGVAIIYSIASLILHSLGVLACFVGVLPAYGYSMLIASDLVAQLHDIFVTRGGPPAIGPDRTDEIVDAQVI